jgi:hypothetical protein
MNAIHAADPTMQPNVHNPNPSSQPDRLWSHLPGNQLEDLQQTSPSGQPSVQPLIHPSIHPSAQPTRKPSSQPTLQPLTLPYLTTPSRQPQMCPSCKPTLQPSISAAQYRPHKTAHPPTFEEGGRAHSLALKEPVQSRQPSRAPSTQPTVQPTDESHPLCAQPVLTHRSIHRRSNQC